MHVATIAPTHAVLFVLASVPFREVAWRKRHIYCVYSTFCLSTVSLLSSNLHLSSISMVSNGQGQGWTVQNGGRGTIDIIWSCLVTLFLCCWTSLCINVPRQNATRWERFLDKFYIALTCILGPDILLILSMGQYEAAWDSVKKFKAANFSKNHSWTLRHAFFANMGGYLLRTPDPDLLDFPVHADQLLFLIENGYVDYPQQDLADLDDKNKRDTLARILTGVQAMIFVSSSIARACEHLAITTLEITTLAFIAAMLATSFFWRHKPQDINRPIVLESKKSMAEILTNEGISPSSDYTYTPLDFLNREEWFCSVVWQTQVALLQRILYFPRPPKKPRKPIDRLRSDDFPAHTLLTELCCGVLLNLYSAIFFAAWHDYFPSQVEKTLWRVSCWVMQAFCVCGWFFFYVDRVIVRKKSHLPIAPWRWPWRWRKETCTAPQVHLSSLPTERQQQQVCRNDEGEEGEEQQQQVCRNEEGEEGEEQQQQVCRNEEGEEEEQQQEEQDTPPTEASTGNTNTNTIYVEQSLTTTALPVQILNKRKNPPPASIPMRFMIPSQAICACYCLARAYVLLEDVIGLRSLPASAYATVPWARYLPHT